MITNTLHFERIPRLIKHKSKLANRNKFKHPYTCAMKNFTRSFIDLNAWIYLSFNGRYNIRHKKKVKVTIPVVINQASKIRDVSELKMAIMLSYDFGIGQYIGLKTLYLCGDKTPGLPAYCL